MWLGARVVITFSEFRWLLLQVVLAQQLPQLKSMTILKLAQYVQKEQNIWKISRN